MTSDRQLMYFVLFLLVCPAVSGALDEAILLPADESKGGSAAPGEVISVVRRYEVGEDDAGRLVRVAGRIAEADVSSEQGVQVVQGRLGQSWQKRRLDIVSLVRRTALRHKVDPDLIYAVIRQESNFDPFAVSHKGALGLMQLMPDTAARFGVKDIFDPAENVDGGVRLLRYLLDRYEGDRIRALAAYNAGEAAVERYDGVPPYRETLDYVDRVSRSYVASKAAVSSNIANSEKSRKVVIRIDPSGAIRFETQLR